MERISRKASLVAAILCPAAIILSIVSLVQIERLSLPCPRSIPILNIIVPIVAILVSVSAKRLFSKLKQTTVSALLQASASASTFVPFVLLVLSFVYGVPSDLLGCAGESQWSRLFRAKNSDAIRGIQNNLHCCGFNSLYDRAWPFPSHDVDARACVRTLNYTINCAEPWMHQETIAAVLSALASLLNWLLMVMLVNNVAGPSAWSQHDITQFIGTQNSRDGRLIIGTIEEGDDGQPEPYQDLPTTRQANENERS